MAAAIRNGFRRAAKPRMPDSPKLPSFASVPLHISASLSWPATAPAAFPPSESEKISCTAENPLRLPSTMAVWSSVHPEASSTRGHSPVLSWYAFKSIGSVIDLSRRRCCHPLCQLAGEQSCKVKTNSTKQQLPLRVQKLDQPPAQNMVPGNPLSKPEMPWTERACVSEKRSSFDIACHLQGSHNCSTAINPLASNFSQLSFSDSLVGAPSRAALPVTKFEPQ